MVDYNGDILFEEGFDPQRIADSENRFFNGNGYLGVRGALEEFRADRLPAVNLSGVYDRFGDGWREPLNAPNPFFFRAYASHNPLFLPEGAFLQHRQSLHILTGTHSRQSVFLLPEGTITLHSERYAHMEQVHLLCMQVTLTASTAADLVLEAGIDSLVWDIHGPHYASMALEQQEELLTALGVSNEGDCVCTAWRGWIDNGTRPQFIADDGLHLARYVFSILPHSPVTLTVFASVYTSRDGGDPLKRAVDALHEHGAKDWPALWMAHTAQWQALWNRARVSIEGDSAAQFALNYSLYHLLCIAPRHHASLSVAARGLSGQTYKGAVFWDTEMFMLDFYLAVLPEVARSVLNYRVDTLPGALQKASEYGLEGAFYAWESQEGGYDACSDYNVTDVFTQRPMRTHFRDKQIHITAAVVFGLIKYTDWTGDESLLLEGGMRVLLEAANFYHSLLVQRVDGEWYELRDVIGPDEYHERVNNNAYTNEMARFVFTQAADRLDWLAVRSPSAYDALAAETGGVHMLADRSAQCRKDALRLKKPTLRDGVIEQFDGYFALEDTRPAVLRARLKHEKEYWGGAYGVAAQTQVIKQADVIALLCMQPHLADDAAAEANYRYYEPRTEHGSSLSACMYALAACRIGAPEEAYPLFMQSAQADLRGGGKQWAGLVYIGGTHPAAAGGAYMVLLRGFLRVVFTPAGPQLSPALPAAWSRVQLNLLYRGKSFRLDTACSRDSS